MNSTIFDKILSGDIPADKVYEDDNVLAFKDIKPRAPIHVLVIPKKKIARIAELGEWTAEETGQFFQAVVKVAGKLGLSEKGYRIVINNGPDGRQEVEYLHAHILGGQKLSTQVG